MNGKKSQQNIRNVIQNYIYKTFKKVISTQKNKLILFKSEPSIDIFLTDADDWSSFS